MKKNRMMRLASVLLVCVLLTTSVISGTFAKYVTKVEGMDQARVAKWGVTIDAQGEMFKTNYDNTAISAVTTEDIVAPGTSGSLVAMDIAGTPEVKVEVKYEANLELTGWKYDTEIYCPIVINVGGTSYTCTGTLGDFESAVEQAINAYTAQYDANVDLATFAETPIVTWSWDFDNSGAGTNDAKDTLLGNAAAAGNASTIKLTVTTTVTQVD